MSEDTYTEENNPLFSKLRKLISLIVYTLN